MLSPANQGARGNTRYLMYACVWPVRFLPQLTTTSIRYKCFKSCEVFCVVLAIIFMQSLFRAWNSLKDLCLNILTTWKSKDTLSVFKAGSVSFQIPNTDRTLVYYSCANINWCFQILVINLNRKSDMFWTVELKFKSFKIVKVLDNVLRPNFNHVSIISKLYSERLCAN